MADITAPMSDTAPSRSLSRTRVSTRRRSYSSYLRWSKSMRMSAQSIDTLLTIALGLGLRYVVDTVSHHSVKVTGSIIGLWEGVILLHFTKKTPQSSDPFVAFGARLVVDFVCTESVARQVLVLLWMWLGMVLADVVPAVWSDKRVRRLRRRLVRRVRSLTDTVPTIVSAPPIHRTIRFVPSNDLHTILEESTQASAAPSVGPPPDEPRRDHETPSAPQPQPQRGLAIHAPLIAIIPALQDAVAAISASQETPVLQLSDFLPPVSSPYEDPQVILQTERTPTTNPDVLALPQDDTLHTEHTQHEVTEPRTEPTEPFIASSVSIVDVPNIDDIEEIVADEADADDVLPAVIRQSGASTPLYEPERHSGVLFTSSPPPHYDYDYIYAGHRHGDLPQTDHAFSADPEHSGNRTQEEAQHGARSTPVYDINDLAEIQNESEDAGDVPVPPASTKPEEDAVNSYVPPTPPESTTFKRRRLDHRDHERLPEGYFSPPPPAPSRPVPRRQESKALPPVPPPDDDDDGATTSDDIYVDDEVDPTPVTAKSRTSLVLAGEGWEKVDLADYAFVPPTRPEREEEEDSPSSYGGPQGRAGFSLFRAPSPVYSDGSSSHRHAVPQVALSHSQESDQELKALVNDLGPLIH